MKTYLSNSFSLNMVPADLWAETRLKQISVEDAVYLLRTAKSRTNSEVMNTIGHADTAATVANELSAYGYDPPKAERATIALYRWDTLVVAQYVGPRLPEGCTALPEGGKDLMGAGNNLAKFEKSLYLWEGSGAVAAPAGSTTTDSPERRGGKEKTMQTQIIIRGELVFADKSGLEALDARRAAGWPDGLDARVDVPLQAVEISEQDLRELAARGLVRFDLSDRVYQLEATALPGGICAGYFATADDGRTATANPGLGSALVRALIEDHDSWRERCIQQALGLQLTAWISPRGRPQYPSANDWGGRWGLFRELPTGRSDARVQAALELAAEQIAADAAASAAAEESRRQYQERERAAAEAAAERRAQQIRAWVEANGTENQRERLAAGLLSTDEALDSIRAEGFEALDTFFPPYSRLQPGAVPCNCTDHHDYGEPPCALSRNTRPATSATAAEYSALEAIRAAVDDPGATVQLWTESLTRADCETFAQRQFVRVTVMLGDLTLTRDYCAV